MGVYFYMLVIASGLSRRSLMSSEALAEEDGEAGIAAISSFTLIPPLPPSEGKLLRASEKQVAVKTKAVEVLKSSSMLHEPNYVG